MHARGTWDDAAAIVDVSHHHPWLPMDLMKMLSSAPECVAKRLPDAFWDRSFCTIPKAPERRREFEARDRDFVPKPHLYQHRSFLLASSGWSFHATVLGVRSLPTLGSNISAIATRSR